VSAKRARSRVVVRARSLLDARAEVLPGERKFLDYAFPPTHVALEVVTNTGGAQFATAGPALSVAERAPSRLARAGCRAVRTARFWRGIVSFTHLARKGRMTVTIGRRELLVALGGAAAAAVVFLTLWRVRGRL